MNPLERLLAESIPDGSFGAAHAPGWSTQLPPAVRPVEPARRPARPPVTPAEAAAHYAALRDALDGTALDEPLRPIRLRVIPGEAA